MDCRTLRLAALGLLLGSWGCSKSSAIPPVAGGPPSGPLVTQHVPPDAKLEPAGPPRQPKPATCVALAVLREQTAETKKDSPAERTELYDQARRAYQQALKLDEKYLPAYKGLARLYETLQDHERAVATYRQAAHHYPREGEVWHLLGMCHARRRDWQQAVDALQKAVELDPENRRYLNDFGLCLARAGLYQDALIVLKKAAGDAQAHYQLARMLEHLGQPEPSREQLRMALQYKPDLEPARQMLYRLDNPGVAEAPAQAVLPVGHQAPAGIPR